QTPLEPRPAAPQVATITYAPPQQPQLEQQLRQLQQRQLQHHQQLQQRLLLGDPEQVREAERQARRESTIAFGKRTAPEEPKDPKE
ncbi:MAG: hypothetical protein ACRC1U_05735, partial [Vibrionaceae bacterium]